MKWTYLGGLTKEFSLSLLSPESDLSLVGDGVDLEPGGEPRGV